LFPSARVVSFGDPPTTSKEEDVTKSEFVDQVSANSGLSKKDAGDAVDAVLQTIEDALKRGSEVTFSGFGKFHVAERSAREGRNPSTGEKIQIAASRVPRFTPGSGLKRAVKS
jgi:DNA-binding protein HU-beta